MGADGGGEGVVEGEGGGGGERGKGWKGGGIHGYEC